MEQITIDEFKQLLKEANLTKREFSELLKISYQGVNNWGTNGREYPYWVKSWLENYIKAKSYDMIKDKVLEIENISKDS
ncbi:helix-turn-helix domain-containing protein [Aliarcobacter cryaerophilus]|uniref:XRE family transcriptional regulator n=1 Tax=Aliarcobacter cryaerophilus TaxID=28198 RepID=UPI0028CB29E8|nr:XRE family transcriptional regulator [Aliarcobacter cryaerophilus]